MWTLTRLLSWRFLMRHRLRMLLATASIALGVATLIAAQVLNHGTQTAVAASGGRLQGQADLHITNATAGVERELLDVVRGVPGVRAALPLFIAEHVTIELPEGGRRRAPVLGVDGQAAELAKHLGLAGELDLAGRFTAWSAAEQAGLGAFAVVGPRLAGGAGGGPFTFQMLTAQGWRQVRAVATLPVEGLAEAALGGAVILRMETAQALFGDPGARGKVSRIDVILEPEADAAAVRAALEAALAGRAEARPPQGRDQSLEDVLAGVQIGLTLGATVALFVGLFLVYNTLAVTVAERRHDIGVLRSLGATRGQIRGLFALEALLLGLIGSPLGILAGWGLAVLSQGSVTRVLQQQFSAIELEGLTLTPGMILLGLAAGIGVSLLASLAPAAAAAAEPPSDALRRVPEVTHPFRLWLPVLFALLTLALSLAVYYRRDAVSAELGRILALSPSNRIGTYLSLYLVSLAFMLVTPFVARLGVAALRPAAGLLGPGARLAADDLARNPSRTGLTIGALAMGVAMTIETAGIIDSTEGPVFQWVADAIRSDLFVTSGSPITGGGEHTSMAETLGPLLAQAPGVREVMPVRLVQVEYRGTRIMLVVLPFEQYARFSRQGLTLGAEDAWKRLTEPGRRQVVISDNLALQQGLSVGDTMELPTPRGPARWTILGTRADYTWNRGVVFMDRSVYQEWFQDTLVDSFDLFLEPGANLEAVRRDLEGRLGKEHALFILTNDQFRGHIKKIMDQFYTLAYANAYMALAVSFLGVASALAISVLQRKRELGLLRAVGATRWQVAWSVSAQALFIGVLGLGAGAALGAFLQAYVLRVLMVEEAGYVFPFVFPATMTLLTAAFAVAAAQLAALLPACRAAGQPISEAVAYE